MSTISYKNALKIHIKGKYGADSGEPVVCSVYDRQFVKNIYNDHATSSRARKSLLSTLGPWAQTIHNGLLDCSNLACEI